MTTKITLTIDLYQEPELPNQWVSRCVELDVLSAGMTPAAALEAVAEAVRMTVHHAMRRVGMTEVETFDAITQRVAARKFGPL